MVFICYELAFVIITGNVQLTVAHLVVYYTLNISLFYFNAYALLNFVFLRTRSRYFNYGFTC
jgi:hypothetical protein